MLPHTCFQNWIYSRIYIDAFAIAHFMYHSALKQQVKVAEGNDSISIPHLDLVAFKGNKNGKNRLVYAQLALGMIEFFESFMNTEQEIFLLFDNPLSKMEARTQLSVSYKENRKSKLSQIFFRTIDFVQFFAQNCLKSHYKIVRVPLREADDVVKVLIEHNPVPALCIANDSDWHGVLRDKPSIHQWWFTYGFEERSIYTAEQFRTEYQFEPSEKAVVLYKALTGDSADCIEPVLRGREVEREELLYLIRTYQDNPDQVPVAVSYDKRLSQNVKTLLKEKRDQFRLNLKLIDRLETPPELIQKYTWEGKNNRVLKEALLKVLIATSQENALAKEYSFGGVRAGV